MWCKHLPSYLDRAVWTPLSCGRWIERTILAGPFEGGGAKKIKLIRIIMVIVVNMPFIGEKEYSFY
jgi:hypothetical protein